MKYENVLLEKILKGLVFSNTKGVCARGETLWGGGGGKWKEVEQEIPLLCYKTFTAT